MWPFETFPSSRPQNIELGATGGASKQDSSNMDDMSVEQITMRANQVTDEVLRRTQRERWNFLFEGFSTQNILVTNAKMMQATDGRRGETVRT